MHHDYIVDYSTLRTEEQDHSESLSKLTQLLAIGMMGSYWTIFSARALSIADEVVNCLPTVLAVRFSVALITLSLLFEFGQYLCGLYMTRIAMDRWDRKVILVQETTGFLYDRAHLGACGLFLYNLNLCLFRLRMASVVLGGILFILVLFAIQID